MADAGPSESDGVGVAALGQPVDHRPAGVAQAEVLGDFVEGFAGGIVHGVAHQAVMVAEAVAAVGERRAGDVVERGVAAGDHQRHHRELDRARLRSLLFLFQQHGMDVAFQVVDPDQWFAQRPGHSFGVGQADQQRADQPRPLSDGDGVHLAIAQPGTLARLPHHRHNPLQVGARGQLRHYPAVLAVDVDLRADHVGEDAPSVFHQRGGGFVAA